MKPVILSKENIRRLTKWFGPDPKDWKGKTVTIYRETLKDVDGKIVGDTIGLRLPNEEDIE